MTGQTLDSQAERRKRIRFREGSRLESVEVGDILLDSFGIDSLSELVTYKKVDSMRTVSRLDDKKIVIKKRFSRGSQGFNPNDPESYFILEKNSTDPLLEKLYGAAETYLKEAGL